jgi:hypothetical protein
MALMMWMQMLVLSRIKAPTPAAAAAQAVLG